MSEGVKVAVWGDIERSRRGRGGSRGDAERVTWARRHDPAVTPGFSPPTSGFSHPLPVRPGSGGGGASGERPLPLPAGATKGSGEGRGQDHVTRRLREREWGRNFSPLERNHLSSRFLPNTEVFAVTYPHKVFCGVFNDDGSLFVSACQDHSLRVFSAVGSELRPLRSTRGRDVGWSILDVAFTPDGAHGLYCSWSPYVHSFNLHGEDETHTAMDLRPPERRFALFSLAVGQGGHEVFGGANDGCVYAYDRGAQRRVLRVEAHEADVNAVAVVDAGGQLVATGGDDGLVRVWDRRGLGSHRPVSRMAGHRGGVTFLHCPGDGRHLVSNSKDQTAKLWDLRRPAGEGAVAAARRAVTTHPWDYRWEEAPPPATTCLPGDPSLVTFRVTWCCTRCCGSASRRRGGARWGRGAPRAKCG
ncbi:DDB1- and CUL4-associated factor 11 [Cuculus canorus]|uniref:DDB1- and CUL4-associated factor 11 n=1 Tax=Cuculus canorus TaxID=55661 RepID=UPI0023AA4001|nr:DDB1- and CUL4-associated factor 11 [Cuculus canorus]